MDDGNGMQTDYVRFDDKIDAYPDNNPKTLVGLSKPSTWGIPPVAILWLGRAMADGIKKYGLMNWRTKRVSSSIYGDAAERHLLAWKDGENYARDSGHHHLAHVMACCAILLDAEETGKLNDDRPTPGNAADMIERLTEKRDVVGPSERSVAGEFLDAAAQLRKLGIIIGANSYLSADELLRRLRHVPSTERDDSFGPGHSGYFTEGANRFVAGSLPDRVVNGRDRPSGFRTGSLARDGDSGRY